MTGFAEFFHPATGERKRCTATVETTDGDLVHFEWHSIPGGVITEHVPPPRRTLHHHRWPSPLHPPRPAAHSRCWRDRHHPGRAFAVAALRPLTTFTAVDHRCL